MELPETEGIKLILARRLDSTSFQKDSLLECERYVRGVQRNLDRTVANGDKRENSKPRSAGGYWKLGNLRLHTEVIPHFTVYSLEKR